MSKTGRTLLSLYFLHQGARFAKITALVLLFGFASWRVIDGSPSLYEGSEREVTIDPSDLFSEGDELSHLRALLLFKSHCQVNQGADLAKISWLLSSTESQLHEPLYLKKGVEVKMPVRLGEANSGVSVEFRGSFPGVDTSARIILKSAHKLVEIALPIESAPLVRLSTQQLQSLPIRYRGMNLLPPEDHEEMNENQLPEPTRSNSTEMISTVSTGEVTTRRMDISWGVFEDIREDCFYFVSSQKLPSSSLFDPLFPGCKIASAVFESEKAFLELFDERGFRMKIELPKVTDSVFARDYFKQILLERVTLGAALVNFKQVKTPIKMGRLYLLNENGCFDLSEKSSRELYTKGELVGQVVAYQGLTMSGTKKEAKFEVIDASRTYEEERVLIHDAKRMDGHPQPALPSSRQSPKSRPTKAGQNPNRSQKRAGPHSQLSFSTTIHQTKSQFIHLWSELVKDIYYGCAR